MKIPLSWLREYVELPSSVGHLIERLTLAGLEVTGVRALGVPVPDGLPVKIEERGPEWQRDKVVIGQILGVERHPNADRLTLATVDYGAAHPKTVVTGAPNIKVGDKGQKVIVAVAGSVLFDGHASPKTLKELKPSKIRGIPSDAMVCSAYELGISDEHEGILLLEEDAPVGTPLVDFMGDMVLEVDVTPNMARCLSMIGVAREVAALTGQTVRLPPHTVQAAGDSIEGNVDVTIEEPTLAARYAACLIQGVVVGLAPGWMQRRLAYAGMRPINNIVDITNYVMLEWGQPLHAFDHASLVRRADGAIPEIAVRSARSGEKITTLDGVVRDLTADFLVIADRAGPIAIAGVMGGADTEVAAATTSVLLESANFNFVSVRRTMKALNLPSEASARFSRGIHPETVRPAAERAADLFRRHAGGIVSKGLVDVYPAPLPAQVVNLDMGEVRRLLGMKFPVDEAIRILRALEFGVEQEGPDQLRVTTPPHRLDIQAGSADLIEELARIHGYDRLPETLLADRLPEQHINQSLRLEEQVRDLLVNCDLQEVITYSLTEPAREAPLLPGNGHTIRLVNPISSERVAMRRTVLAGVLEVAAANLRHTDTVRLFEIGSVFLPRLGEKLPDEPRRLAILLTGRRRPDYWGEPATAADSMLDFYALKGVIEVLTADLHVEAAFEPASAPFLHPGRAAELLIGGEPAGTFGEMHPRAVEQFGLSGGPILVAELNMDVILAAVPERFLYTPVARFPAALRDIAVIVDEALAAERVVGEIRMAGGALLAGLRLFDVYRGESIAPGKKSLAYALTYQASDRTLTDKEVDKAHRKIEERLKQVLKAQIRGQEPAA